MARNGTKTGGGSRKGKPNKDTAQRRNDIRAIARSFIDDPEYREALKERLKAGTAGSMETLLWNYAFGRVPLTSGDGDPLPIAITVHF